MTSSEPKWVNAVDATLFATYRDQQRLILFLMMLSNVYEPVRASLLHRIWTLLMEIRLGLILTSHMDTSLAASSSKGHGSSSDF